MCLAVPMKIIKIEGDNATAGYGPTKRSVNISLVKGLKKGDYVLIHAGFAIEKVRPAQARQTLKSIKAVSETY